MDWIGYISAAGFGVITLLHQDLNRTGTISQTLSLWTLSAGPSYLDPRNRLRPPPSTNVVKRRLRRSPCHFLHSHFLDAMDVKATCQLENPRYLGYTTSELGQARKIIVSWDNELDLPQDSLRAAWGHTKEALRRVRTALRVTWYCLRRGYTLKPGPALQPGKHY